MDFTSSVKVQNPLPVLDPEIQNRFMSALWFLLVVFILAFCFCFYFPISFIVLYFICKPWSLFL